MNVVKFEVGNRIWLVPEKEVTQPFHDAMAKLVRCSHGERLDWNEKEASEFRRVSRLEEVWTL